MCRIDLSTRLRRAIHLNDSVLVARLIRNHSEVLQNPDFNDKSNTSLHLAAFLGHKGIAELLINAGHDKREISRNAEHDTPLMLAARNGHVEIGKLLIKHFPRSINFSNGIGLDALSLSCQTPASTSLIPILLNPGADVREHAASVEVRDLDGNTALHHASASGSLKALRILLAAGANPLAKNNHDWTPLAYSQTVAAEVYFKNLVAELERRRVEGLKADEERERQRAAGMRVVAADDESGTPRGKAELNTPVDEESAIHDALKRHWTPTIDRNKRPMTPVSGQKTPTHEWDNRFFHARARSGSGD